MPLLDKLLRDKSYACINVQQEHTEMHQVASPLVLNEDYFRIVVCQLFIKNAASLLGEYLPMVYSKVDFQFGAQTKRVSHVIDPRSDQYKNRAGIIILNQHIMQPVPFTDHHIDVSLALARVKVADHASTVIKILWLVNQVKSIQIPLNKEYTLARANFTFGERKEHQICCVLSEPP